MSWLLICPAGFFPQKKPADLCRETPSASICDLICGFCACLPEARRQGKPYVVYVTGHSNSGWAAVASHTCTFGSLFGDSSRRFR